MELENFALIWDMDGTIIDSRQSHFIAWEKTLNHHGYTLDQDVYNNNFGRNSVTILPIFLGFKPEPSLRELLLKEKRDLFLQIAPKETKLIPGVESWIKAANSLGIPQVIASSSNKDSIEMMLSNFNLLHYFETIVSGDHQPAKPNPKIFLTAARALKRTPQQCLVIEDSTYGVEAAKRAQMACIAITTTSSCTELCKADVVIDNYFEPLEEIFKNFCAAERETQSPD